MYDIIAIMGEAGSGKDSIMQGVLKQCPTLHEIVSCTSRPIREGEQEGVNYHYYSPTDFSTKIFKNEMLEYTIFNGWFYGTGFDSVEEDKLNIGVFNPEGIHKLLQRKDCNLKIFYVRASPKNRLLRQLNRESDPDVAEIVRRFKTDTEDFESFDFEYTEIPNNTWEEFENGIIKILTEAGIESPKDKID